MQKVTTALIGCGQRGPAHARTAKESEKLELIAVCDIDDARAKEASEQFGVKYYTDYRELLNRDDLESVMISTHTRHHAEIALDAVRRGKHLVVEKPLVDSLAKAKELVEAAEQAGIIGMVGYQLRFTSFDEALKRESEKIDLLQITFTQQRGFMNPQYFMPEHYGGIMDAVSHTFDLALWIMEDPPTSVYADIRRGTFAGAPKPKDDDTIDFINVIIECGSGDNRRVANISSSMAGAQMQNVYQLVGKRGNVSAVGRASLKVVRHNGFRDDKEAIDLHVETLQLENNVGSSLARLYDHFAGCVRGEAAPRITLQQGMYSIAVSEAVAESGRTGKKVEIESGKVSRWESEQVGK